MYYLFLYCFVIGFLFLWKNVNVDVFFGKYTLMKGRNATNPKLNKTQINVYVYIFLN